MKTASILNLKGGPGKTTTAINMAHSLATRHNKKVLLIDNDPQGNTTGFYGLNKNEIETITDILTTENYNVHAAIYSTNYENIDIIGANMNLFRANAEIANEAVLKTALQPVADLYDYCIIDNAPTISVSMINGLVLADEIILPVVIDQFSFEGMADMAGQLELAKQLNPTLTIKGCLVTQWSNDGLNIQGKELLKGFGYPVFNTNIRWSKKVKESTFARKPILEYSPRCAAAQDYKKFVAEYLGI